MNWRRHTTDCTPHIWPARKRGCRKLRGIFDSFERKRRQRDGVGECLHSAPQGSTIGMSACAFGVEKEFTHRMLIGRMHACLYKSRAAVQPYAQALRCRHYLYSVLRGKTRATSWSTEYPVGHNKQVTSLTCATECRVVHRDPEPTPASFQRARQKMLIQSWVWGSPQLWPPVRKPRIHTQAMVRMTSRIGPRQV